MTTSATLSTPSDPIAVEPVVVLHRRTIDAVLIGIGALVAVVLVIAGALLTWGHNFSTDYVTNELSSQHITFPSAEGMTTEGRTDLLEFAGQPLNNGDQAQGYASYIDGHLQKVADGATFADLGTPERAANDAVKAAVTAGSPQPTIDELTATAAGITGQRNTLFKGETLRGLLLSAYAWSMVGRIAGIAAIAAFAAAVLMLVFVALGLVHHRRATHSLRPASVLVRSTR